MNTTLLNPANIKRGALIELRDVESGEWIPLTIVSIVMDHHIECRTLANEPIHTTKAALFKDARLRPGDGTCRDCGTEAHNGPCIDRICSECNAQIRSHCIRHPEAPINVYRRKRYLAEIVADKPYPTRESAEALIRDLHAQMRMLRDAEQPRQSRVMITVTERAEVMSALENAIALIDSLPGKRRQA